MKSLYVYLSFGILQIRLLIHEGQTPPGPYRDLFDGDLGSADLPDYHRFWIRFSLKKTSKLIDGVARNDNQTFSVFKPDARVNF